jgi:hypothetical protein
MKREYFLFIRLKKEKLYYNKQKIQVFFINKGFISSCGMKIIIFHSWLLPLMKYSLDENKSCIYTEET